MLTLDERDHLLRRQGRVCRELEDLRADTFCPGGRVPADFGGWPQQGAGQD